MRVLAVRNRVDRCISSHQETCYLKSELTWVFNFVYLSNSEFHLSFIGLKAKLSQQPIRAKGNR